MTDQVIQEAPKCPLMKGNHVDRTCRCDIPLTRDRYLSATEGTCCHEISETCLPRKVRQAEIRTELNLNPPKEKRGP